MIEDIHETARRCIANGWKPIPIVFQQKNPVIEGWQRLSISEGEVARYFTDPCNIGLLLGEPSGGLVDIDLDCPQAIAAADILLPQTGMIHGRTSRPMSHRWYIARGISSTRQYHDPEDRSMLAELRSTGVQTIIPPSIQRNARSKITANRK